jgi:uncharacterized membrane protein YeaQ/YmgE (transglycosylase-associated protein family)
MGLVLSIIGWIIAGAIIGLIARAIVPGKQDLSLPLTAGLGIVGMLIGAIVGSVIPPDNDGVPWIMGIVCSAALLFWLTRSNNLSRFTGN